MTTALHRESVARVGARVRALHRLDAAHTDRAVVISLAPVAPVALCRFHCGCVSYVPLRRLALDIGPEVPACEVSGCRNPRWEGPHCSAHPRGATMLAAGQRRGEANATEEASDVDPQARSASSPVDAPVEAGPPGGNGRPGRPDEARGGSTPSPRARQPRATGTAAARSGAGGSAASSASGRMIWTPERVIAALREHARVHGRTPAFGEWTVADPSGRRPTAMVVRDRFGSWSAGVAAAGLEARGEQPRTRKWTREAIIAALRAHHAATGGTPRRDDWHLSTDEHPVGETVAKVFGTWNAGVIAAGLTARPPGRPRKQT